jgi:hypothetical protein
MGRAGLLIVAFVAVAASPRMGVAQLVPRPDTPRFDPPFARGFSHYYKCPDADFDVLGDTVTSEACLSACRRHGTAAGCWWLDGTWGFPRECRICRAHAPVRGFWPNDWALPLSGLTS